MSKRPTPHMECGKCEKSFPITPDNSMVAKFSEEPEYDYLLTECECGGWNRNFVDDSTIKMLIARKIPLYEAKYAPPDVVFSYIEATNTPLITAHDLTTSEEHLVEYFRWVLERGDQE